MISEDQRFRMRVDAMSASTVTREARDAFSRLVGEHVDLYVAEWREHLPCETALPCMGSSAMNTYVDIVKAVPAYGAAVAADMARRIAELTDRLAACEEIVADARPHVPAP